MILFTLGAVIYRHFFSLSHLCFKYTSQVWTLNTGNGSLIYSLIPLIISFFIATLAINSSWTLWSILSMVLPNQFLTLCPCQRAAPIPFPLSFTVSGLSVPSLTANMVGNTQLYQSSQPLIHVAQLQLRPHHCITILYFAISACDAPIAFIVLLLYAVNL